MDGRTDPGAIVPRDGSEVVVSTRGRLIPVEGTPLLRCPTNLDIKAPAGRALLFKATSPGDLDGELHNTGRVVMAVTAFACFPDEAIDEDTGEISKFTRSVLYDRCGNTMRLSGDHIPHRIAALTDLYGADEWERGIPVEVKVRRSRRGRDYHDIRVLVNDGEIG